MYVHSFKKLAFSLLMIILILSVQACSPGTQDFNPEPPPGEESPPGEFFEGEPPLEGEEPPPGGVQIEFNAERPSIMPGECTMLFWHTEGGHEVFYNGEPVAPSGEREECLDEPRMFMLEVATEHGMEMREIEVMVAGEPGEEPPLEEPPMEEPPMEEPPPQEPQPEPPQPQPQTQQQPQTQPQQQPQQQNQSTNICQSNFQTDIAVTDIYAGNLPNGQVHVRITNHGPCTLNNVKDQVYCFIDLTNHSNGKVSYDAKTVNVTYNMASGVQQTFPTGITLDTNVYNYKVTCNLQPGSFQELNANNNSYTENIP